MGEEDSGLWGRGDKASRLRLEVVDSQGIGSRLAEDSSFFGSVLVASEDPRLTDGDRENCCGL